MAASQNYPEKKENRLCHTCYTGETPPIPKKKLRIIEAKTIVGYATNTWETADGLGRQYWKQKLFLAVLELGETNIGFAKHENIIEANN